MSGSQESSGGPAGRIDNPDEVDRRILAGLRDNGRISMSALAEQVGVSRATVYTRVENMVARGVITGFSARVDPRKVGFGICTLVFVTVRPQSWKSFRSRVVEMPQVEYCAVTTGQHDAMLLVRGRDVAEVHEFVTEVLSVLPQIKAVESVLVMDEVVSRAFLLPDDIPAVAPASQSLGMTRFIRAGDGHAGLESL
ncbi:Lrp/AsnC family transcriptional regulator [Pseudonocardia sp. DSM 110487]|uniref:Lrp/AsnC family transcriptional regulator n=1 Tax=Pseudonocardia sp. DSM 110487 TaxID=2865833 RepID=UPI001C6A1C7F|nr:Lrp/AsnC family transcriptional regulator [Pseudonocardia sp. DSM 110487]QYN34159.1 Lrp/AsnC family transcriptional regulator [Pseudonocardia sp. DSM 110487]